MSRLHDSSSEDESDTESVRPHWRTSNRKSSRIARKKSISPAKLPTFDQVVPETPVRTLSPSVLKALHRSTEEIRTLKISAVDYYKNLEVNSVLLSRRLPPRGHVDGGALATTTDRKNYLWHYHEYDEAERPKSPRLKVADDTVHRPDGYGYLKVPCDSAPGYLFVLTYYTPAIPATIMSPDDMCRALKCRGYQTFSDIVDERASMRLADCESCDGSMDFSLQVIRGLLYTDSLILPLDEQRLDTGPPAHPTCDIAHWNGANEQSTIHALTQEQQRMLWHMRLGHTNHRAVADAHKFVNGIPKLPRADLLDDCPICKRTKLHKAARGDLEDIDSEECWQHINIDFGFIVQKSSESDRKKKKRSRSATSKSSGARKSRKRIMKPAELKLRAIRRSLRVASRKSKAPIVDTASSDSESDVEHDSPTPPPRRRPSRSKTNTVLLGPHTQRYWCRRNGGASSPPTGSYRHHIQPGPTPPRPTGRAPFSNSLRQNCTYLAAPLLLAMLRRHNLLEPNSVLARVARRETNRERFVTQRSFEERYALARKARNSVLPLFLALSTFHHNLDRT